MLSSSPGYVSYQTNGNRNGIAGGSGDFQRGGSGTSSSFTVYIGNLPPSIKQSEIEQIFTGLKVKHIKLSYDQQTHAFKGFGYVEFEDAMSTSEALMLNGQMLGDREIRVNMPEARPQTERQNPSSRAGGFYERSSALAGSPPAFGAANFGNFSAGSRSRQFPPPAGGAPAHNTGYPTALPGFQKRQYRSSSESYDDIPEPNLADLKNRPRLVLKPRSKTDPVGEVCDTLQYQKIFGGAKPRNESVSSVE